MGNKILLRTHIENLHDGVFIMSPLQEPLNNCNVYFVFCPHRKATGSDRSKLDILCITFKFYMTQYKILHEDATDHSQLYPASFCYSSEEIEQAKDSYHRTLIFNIDEYSCLTWIFTKRYLDRNIWCSCTQFHSFLLNDKIHSLTTISPQSKCNIISMV